MKIVIPKKLESIDIFAATYIIYTVSIMNSNLIHKESLIINLLTVLMYFKVRFIKYN